MTRAGTRLLCALSLLLLAACGSSPPVRYYRLDTLDVDYGAAAGPAAKVLALGPFTFPDYLQRPELIRRGRGAEMRVETFSRWAEPLDEAVPRIVAANVDGLVDGLAVVPAARRTVAPDYRLFATVYRFDADTEGRAELLVQWGVNATDGGAVVRPRTSRYSARVSPADEPGAMAVAMSGLLEQFSRDVAAALTPAVSAGAR